jgi:SnoaL-like domain
MTTTLSKVISELGDRESIRECLCRYTRGVDRMDADMVRSPCWPDVLHQHLTSSEIRRNLLRGLFRIKKTHDTYGVTSMHHVHSPIITFESPTRARGIWSMEDQLWWTVDGVEHWSHGWGFYATRLPRYVRGLRPVQRLNARQKLASR